MAEVTTDQLFANTVLRPKNLRGEDAPVEAGSVVWASSDDTVLRVTPSADGMTASVTTVGAGGPARISVTADADMGAGVSMITGVSEDVTVTVGPNSMASTIALELGAPSDK